MASENWLETFRAIAFGTFSEPERKRQKPRRMPRQKSEPRRCECGTLLNGRHSTMCAVCAKKRRAERAARRYARVKAAGLCGRCRKPLPEGWTKTKCPDCLAASSTYRRTKIQEQENSMRKRLRASEAGLCSNCLKPSDRPGHVCSACLERHRRNQAARRRRLAEAGICTSCGKVSVAGTGRKKCQRCSESNREYLRRSRERKKENAS